MVGVKQSGHSIGPRALYPACMEAACAAAFAKGQATDGRGDPAPVNMLYPARVEAAYAAAFAKNKAMDGRGDPAPISVLNTACVEASYAAAFAKNKAMDGRGDLSLGRMAWLTGSPRDAAIMDDRKAEANAGPACVTGEGYDAGRTRG